MSDKQTLTILNVQYDILHTIEFNNEIKHISGYIDQLSVVTTNNVFMYRKFEQEMRKECVIEQSDVICANFFDNGNGMITFLKKKILCFFFVSFFF